MIDELATVLYEGEIENTNDHTRKRLGTVLGNVSELLGSRKNSRELILKKLRLYDSIMKIARAGNLCVAIEDGKPVAMSGFQPNGELKDGRKLFGFGRLVALPEYRGGRKWFQVVMKVFEAYKAKHNPSKEPLIAGTMDTGLARIIDKTKRAEEVTAENIEQFGFQDELKKGILESMEKERYRFFFFDGSRPQPEKK